MKSKTKIITLSLLVILSLGATCYMQYILPNEPMSPLTLSALMAIPTIALILVGNYLLNHCLSIYIPWKKSPEIRFLMQMLIGTIGSLAVLNIAYQYIKTQFTDAPADVGQFVVLNIYGALLILPIFAFFFGFKFLKAWRKSELETERLQKENARTQMMTLRNHLDPHFLFNNLNTVSSLIDTDVELSKKYLDKFAEVYRIILRTEYSDLSTVGEELHLIESYCYLLKIRFQDRLFVNIDVSDTIREKAIPPLSLQMLVENAIKHNVASLESPVTINIKSNTDNEISITNNKQLKKYGDEKASGTGINNIESRYEFFTERKINIDDADNQYTVILPVLDIDYD